MIRHNLECGDFSVLDYTDKIFVERKTVSDLCGSYTHGRERFEDEWRRSEKYRVKYLMIEGDLQEILNAEYRSQVHPHALIASIVSWSMKYHFNWFCVPDCEAGEEVLVWLFRQYLRLVKEEKIGGN